MCCTTVATSSSSSSPGAFTRCDHAPRAIYIISRLKVDDSRGDIDDDQIAFCRFSAPSQLNTCAPTPRRKRPNSAVYNMMKHPVKTACVVCLFYAIAAQTLNGSRRATHTQTHTHRKLHKARDAAHAHEDTHARKLCGARASRTEITQQLNDRHGDTPPRAAGDRELTERGLTTLAAAATRTSTTAVFVNV